MGNFIPLSKPGLTAKQILQSTPRVTHGRAMGVKVSSITQSPGEFGTVFRANTRTVRDEAGVPIKGSSTYVSTVAIVNERYGFVKVDCTCGYHPFYGAEVALSLRKAADIIRSNGRAPKVRNASLTPYACKHLIAMFKVLQSKGKLK